MAHAAVKIILANGGEVFTQHEVDRVIIENGKASGVRLTDGTEVQATKLVVSTLDPYTLCFQLIGEEYIDWQILQRVRNLERSMTCITWYSWALHERPQWKAASFNPDINEITRWVLARKNPQAHLREQALIRAGKMPDALQLMIVDYSLTDELRMPEGKHIILTEQFVLPADALTEREWLEFKKSHAEAVLKLWQEHAPNMTWDNVIGYVPITPYDILELANMGPTGNWAVIDEPLYQVGKYRPLPELARYKTPIKNLYATGSAWHPLGAGAGWQSYNCYKIIAEDFGLRKPWEEKGQPW
jgi:phytoene dehydrogenase-like protein